jgi:peptide deformylase
MKLIKFPNDMLKKTMPEFDFDNPVMHPKQLEKEMVELMVQEKGIGLSANQVGIEARVIVIFPRDISLEMGPFAMFNPEIMELSEELGEGIEGCLSFPDLIVPIKRPRIVVVQYLDNEGNNNIIELKDTDARCVLHEIEHLDGICFTDKVSKLKIEMARKKLSKLRKKYGRAQRQS